MNLSYDLAINISKKFHCLSLFIDFQKAFDTLDRKILMTKLYRLGIRGVALNLIQSYFENRHHFTAVNDVTSMNCLSTVGTIQGSTLGPLFYIIYANDMNQLFESDTYITNYADDTVITVHDKNIHDVYSKINTVIHRLMDWAKFNK